MASAIDVASNAAGRFVAGLQHVFQSWRKPFNPILGETWQVCGARLCGCALVPCGSAPVPCVMLECKRGSPGLRVNPNLTLTLS